MSYKKEFEEMEKEIPREEESTKPKQTEPIHYENHIDYFLREPRIEDKYIKPMINEIISKSLDFIPEFRIELRDLDKILIELFHNEPKRFVEYIQKELYRRLTFEADIGEFLKENSIKSNDLHIIPDPMELEILIPTIDDLSINLTNYKGKFCRYIGRYMNIGIDKSVWFNWIAYRCNTCNSEFEKSYFSNIINTRINKPKYCIKPKCRNKDFEIISSDSFEVGSFIIEDLDLRKTGNYKICYIFQNIDYFIEKIKAINLNEEIEVVGILNINYFDLETIGRGKQKFDYYIEVFDIKPKRIKLIDDNIVKTLRKKLIEQPSYFERLIDCIHPLTYLIDIYYPIKLASSFSFLSGGSWNRLSNIRDTINSIIAGAKSTYKSSILRNFEELIGKRHFLVYEVNKDMTKAGLIGTTERDPTKIRPTVRYGILPLYSDNTLVFDEAQKINSEILDTFRCLEKGSSGGIQDGIYFEGETKESIVLAQNFVKNDDGSYNAYNSLFDNLGWADKNSESRLERFDFLYIIPKPDIFIKARTLDNEEKISKGVLLKEIAKDLEIEDYEFPKKINTIRGKIGYILFTFFHKAKEIYRKTKLTEKNKEILRELYRIALTDKENPFETETDINIRSLNICYKSLKVLASLRLDINVNERDFNYFKQKSMKLIIPFRNSNLIETKTIDINEIFREAFKTILKEEISIKNHIDSIRAYIKRRWYNDETNERFEIEILDFIGQGDRLNNNYEYRKLLRNNENWLKEQGYYIESKRGKGNITVIRKLQQENEILKINDNSDIKKDKNKKLTSGDLANYLDHDFDNYSDIKQAQNVFIRIKEIFEENEYKDLEIKNVKQILKLESVSKTLFQKTIDIFFNIGILIDIGRNMCNMDEKWR